MYLKEQVNKFKIGKYMILKKTVFWTIIINSIFAIYALLFFTPYNETNDDIGMNDIVSGAYGEKSPFMVFSNIIYGYILKGVYSICPDVNWYTVIQLITVFASFVAIGYVLCKKMGNKFGALGLFFLLKVFYSQFYLVLQFTRISVLCCFAGYLLVFYSLSTEQVNKKEVLYGGILLILGYLMRFSGFKVVTLFAFILGIYHLFCDGIIQKPKENYFKLFKYIKTFTILFGIIGICILVNNLAYSRNTEWKEYREYTKIRAELMDYGWPDYYEYENEYSKLGISENDFNLYSSGNMADDNMLSLEKLKVIEGLKQPRGFSLIEYGYYWKSRLLHKPFIIALFGVLAVFALVNKFSWRHYLCIIAEGFTFLGVIGYYFYLERMLDRMLNPAILIFMTIILYNFESQYYRIKSIGIYGLGVQTVIVLTMSFSLFIGGYKGEAEKRIDADSLYQLLSNKDNIYVADHRVFFNNSRYFDAYHVSGENLYSNQVNFGGWLARTPILNQTKNELGIDNILNAMGERSNVFFYCEGEREKSVGQYMNEHYYNSTVGYSIYDDLEFCRVVKYQVKSEGTLVAQGLGVRSIANSWYNGYYDITVNLGDINAIQSDSDIYIEAVEKSTGLKKLYRVYLDEIQKGWLGETYLKAIVPSEQFELMGDELGNIGLYYSFNIITMD